MRGGTDIPLPHLSFELLLARVRAAPDLVTFDQLSERVWIGLVVTPETISQRVKPVREALGDDPHAARYIAGVRGRGYRMVAAVRPLADRRRAPAALQAGLPQAGAPAVDAPDAPASASRQRARVGQRGRGVHAVVPAARRRQPFQGPAPQQPTRPFKAALLPLGVDAGDAPAYKYSVTVGGKVLDPIVIVDK